MIDRIVQLGESGVAGPVGPTLGINGWLLRVFFRTGKAASEVGHLTDTLYLTIFWVCAFFFVLLMTLMVVFTIKYRRRPGVAPLRSAAHNTPLELTWTIVPLAILAYFFFKGFWGYMDHAVAPGDATEIVMVGRKWAWEARYPNGARSTEVVRIGAIDVPVFVVAAGRPYKLRMYSEDVIHSFWVPDFRVKFDVFPNRYTNLWFRTDEEDLGEHYVFCAEYCGDNHSEMAAIIRVVPPDEYERKVAEWARPTGTPVEVGAALYRIKGCSACHSVDGSRLVGPTWQNLFGYERAFADGTTAVADENYLRESILVPHAKVVQGYPNSMPAQQGLINAEELESLIAYIKSLSDRGPSADETNAEAGGGEGQAESGGGTGE